MYENEMWEVGNTAPRTAVRINRGSNVVKSGGSVVIRERGIGKKEPWLG